MGSAKNTSNASRKARIEELRRAERARERRNRILTITASVVVVAGLVVGGVVLVKSQSDKNDSASDSKTAGHFVTGKDGVKTWQGTLARNHVSKTVTYPMEPPVGGDHNQVWMNCNGDVYAKAVNNMNAVHSLEHGAVWVTYNSKASDADVKALAAKVKKTPYTLMSPVDDQKDPIMLSAWGKQRTVTGASDPNVDKFFSEFVQGKQTPEPGAACTNGLSQ
ncbi:hypothetical protein BKI49_09895 [Streptomyces sp. Tue6028]|uniref:DUF3105 domain-containing protein n=1 Tax=Streptomyces sp. Tue6028 TaxID=2036037 RepID=UPI000BB314CD|nr:DUF3105 domain-containing protein [Streptomyces sp. Tue6028]PBC64011.1 hypothetical protein BKI49_09895 [Streptomyces sp. Tue6028]